MKTAGIVMIVIAVLLTPVSVWAQQGAGQGGFLPSGPH